MSRRKDNFDWLKERLGYMTRNEIFTKVNENIDSPVETFRPGAWTILKEMLIAYYAPSYLRILRNQDWVRRLVFIDLFSGSGLIGIQGLNKTYLGSPIVITHCIGNVLFDEYYFVEKDQAKLDQLKGVIDLGDHPDGIELFPGDCNRRIDDMMEHLHNYGTHSLVFVDPFATEIEFETIRKLGDIGCDLIITVATEEIRRSIAQSLNNPEWNSDALDRFFGNEEWRERFANIESDEEIFEYYAQLVMNKAYKKQPIGMKIQKTLEGHHYFVLFTSTWGKGSEPSFFRILKDFNRRIASLSGEEILRYLKYYTEGNGRGLDGFS